MLELQDLMQR